MDLISRDCITNELGQAAGNTVKLESIHLTRLKMRCQKLFGIIKKKVQRQ